MAIQIKGLTQTVLRYDLHKNRNTTHGSGWMVQVQPTKQSLPRGFEIPLTEVSGWFKSGLRRLAHLVRRLGQTVE
jgi:hypothetical protein